MTVSGCEQVRQEPHRRDSGKTGDQQEGTADWGRAWEQEMSLENGENWDHPEEKPLNFIPILLEILGQLLSTGISDVIY